MSATPVPPTHTVAFHRGHCSGTFTTNSEKDAKDRAASWEATGFEVAITPIPRPEVPEGLRPIPEPEEVAA